MVKLIFEGIEDFITLEEFKEDYKMSMDNYYDNIEKVEDSNNTFVIIYYNDGTIRKFKRYPFNRICEFIEELPSIKKIQNIIDKITSNELIIDDELIGKVAALEEIKYLIKSSSKEHLINYINTHLDIHKRYLKRELENLEYDQKCSINGKIEGYEIALKIIEK